MRIKQHELQITVQIGKNGVTPEIIEEIRKQLKLRGIIKVKMLRGFVESLATKKEKAAVAARIAEEVRATVDGMTGFVFVLKRAKPVNLTKKA